MRHFLIVLIVSSISLLVNAQQIIPAELVHDNIDRDYIIYLPENYTGDEAVPLVFNFHGLGSNAMEQLFYGDFRNYADTAGFIIVHPEGTLFNGATHWNVGGFTVGSTVDDVGFTNAMIDAMANDYNVDLTRVYSTGMSNGGYMSYLLACQLSDRIAAVASVTGSMSPPVFADCDPQHPMPTMQVHGTEDPTVPYAGDIWTQSIESVVSYWADFNNCNSTPLVTDIPDVSPNDGSTVEHFIYAEGDLGATTEFFKVTGGGHTWPGTAFGNAVTNYDINATAEIWDFFSRYDINGLIMPSATDENLTARNINIYPNPVASLLHIEGEVKIGAHYSLINQLGQVVLNSKINSQKSIDLTRLSTGIYFLNIDGQILKVIK